ncbi:MAG: hypothetical protein WC582_00620 [Patescibacteria group bacterium]|jgi:hypothetical protein
MGINPFRKSVISRMKTNSFKSGIKEKTDLARSAGSRGFSKRQMDEKLKEAGYNVKKRTGIMGQISKNKSENQTEEQKRRNIIGSRMTAISGKTAYASSQVSFGGTKMDTRSRVSVDRGNVGKTPNRFGLGSPSSPNQGMANPTMPSASGLGPKRFL